MGENRDADKVRRRAHILSDKMSSTTSQIIAFAVLANLIAVASFKTANVAQLKNADESSAAATWFNAFSLFFGVYGLSFLVCPRFIVELSFKTRADKYTDFITRISGLGVVSALYVINQLSFSVAFPISVAYVLATAVVSSLSLPSLEETTINRAGAIALKLVAAAGLYTYVRNPAGAVSSVVAASTAASSPLLVGVVDQDVFVTLASIFYIAYALGFVFVPRLCLEIHYYATANKYHAYMARIGGVSMLALFYALHQLPASSAFSLALPYACAALAIAPMTGFLTLENKSMAYAGGAATGLLAGAGLLAL